MRVIYSSDGEGRWWRTEWALQCEEKVFLMAGSQCQGTAGHDNVHWCFRLDGSFIWDDNVTDERHDGAAGSIPPGHEEYRTPESMLEHHHLQFKIVAEVTDQAIIEGLEKDKTPEPFASVNRPSRPGDLGYEESE